jgi:hypothetical protein
VLGRASAELNSSGNSLHFASNREKYREFFRRREKTIEFCPKSANSVWEQGINRELPKFPANH